jgi:hypothetical protein
MGTKCSSGCKTRDHASYGECIADKGVRTYGASVSKGFDGSTQKRWDGELAAYRAARAQGIQPDGTTRPKIEAALRASDAAGAAYGRDFNVAPPMEG